MTDTTTVTIDRTDHEHEERCYLCREPSFSLYRLTHWASEQTMCSHCFIDVLEQSIGAGDLELRNLED